MVGQIQGRAPERVHVVLGTDETRSYRPRDFQAYADRVQGRFLRTLQAYRKGAAPPYPYPVEHCAYCDWWARCRDRRRADDHLSLVASITRAQAIRLEDAGVRRVTELADVPAGVPVPGISSPALAGLRQQAWLQVESRDSDVPLHERLPGAPGRGFARLPPPSRRRRVLRHRGRPVLEPRGPRVPVRLAHRTDGYQPLWAHDRAQERAVYERWIDWITARLERHPDLHVYHYNHYEPTALKALMARYGTREAEVDDLLRRKVLVDLYTVVRQALRLGTESYSLKAVEAMYAFEREAEVTEAGGSILAYQEYLSSRDASKLEAIADYNADDCRSTLGLRDWLLAERGNVAYQDAAPPSPPSAQQLARHAEVERLERELLADGEDPGKRLLADLLQYHRREARPEWWAYFDRLGRTAAELRDDDPEAIGDLAPADDVPLGEVAQSYLHPLRFPPQQHKLGPGIAVDPETQRGYEIPRIDDGARARVAQARPRRGQPAAAEGADPRQADPAGRPAGRAARARRAGHGHDHGAQPRVRPAAADAAAAAGRHARRARRAPRRLGAVRPGAARVGQDLHRRAADLRAARGGAPGRRGGDLAQGDRQPARRGRARRRRVRRGLPRAQEVRRRQPRVALRERAHRLLRRRRRVPARRRGGADRRHAVAVGARAAARLRGRAVRRRGGPDGARRRARDRRGRPGHGAARRPAAARARRATARIRAGRARPCSSTCSATARRSRPPRACSWSARGGCTPTSAASSRTRCTTGAWYPSRAPSARPSRPRGCRARACG